MRMLYEDEEDSLCEDFKNFFEAKEIKAWFSEFLWLRYEAIRKSSDLDELFKKVEKKCACKYSDEVYAQKELEFVEKKLERAISRCERLESKAGVFFGMALTILTLVMGSVLFNSQLGCFDYLNYVLFFILVGFVLFAMVMYHLWITLKPISMLEADDVYGSVNDPIPSKKQPLTYVHQMLSSNLVNLKYRDYMNEKKGLSLRRAINLSIGGFVSIVMASLFASFNVWHTFLMSCLSSVCKCV